MARQPEVEREARAVVSGLPPDLPASSSLGGRLVRDAVAVAVLQMSRERDEALAEAVAAAVVRDLALALAEGARG